jgi:hypothetical protein
LGSEAPDSREQQKTDYERDQVSSVLKDAGTGKNVNCAGSVMSLQGI